MPVYEITAPNGKTYEVTAPEGATRDEALTRFKSNYSGQQAPEEQPPEELGGMDRARGIGTALAGGATFGWGDEISSGLATVLAKTLGGDDKDFGDIYDDIYAAETGRQKEYETLHPKEALGLNIAGGLTTGGMGLSKTLASNKVKNMGRLGKVATAMGVGATEGGIAGAGSAAPDERLGGAATGTVTGAVLPAALSGSKAVLDTVGKQRIAQELKDKAGNFLPINLLDDGPEMLKSFYRKTVGPSFGGEQLRSQNKSVLNKAKKFAEQAETAKQTEITGGRKLLDKSLRREAIDISIPSGVSDEVRAAINKADGQDAMKLLKESWKDGFSMVKDKTFEINPKQIVDDVVGDLDSPVDADFVSNIRGILNKKLGQGFKPDTAPPSVKYSKKGVGTQKNPDVKLDTGSLNGDNLIEARNALKRQANELGTEGSAALQKSALTKAADKIDDQIRASLGKADAKKFDDELSSYGKYQVARGAVKKAVSGKQGEWTIEDYLTSGSQRQGRSAEIGEAALQKRGQELQIQGQEAIESLTQKSNLAKEAQKSIEEKMTVKDPALWSKTFTTGALGLPAAPLGPTAVAATGTGIGAGLSTEGMQRFIAGQTDPQKLLAERLRKWDASKLPIMLQQLQGASSRAMINEQVGE